LLGAAHQCGDPIPGDFCPPQPHQQHGEQRHEVGQELQIGDEQSQVSHGEVTRTQGARGQQQDDSGADRRRAAPGGQVDAREQLLADRRPAVGLAEAVQVSDNALLRPRHLDRLDRRQNFAECGAHLAGGLAARPPIGGDARICHAAQRSHRGKGHHDAQRDDDVDAEHDHERQGSQEHTTHIGG